MYKGGEIQNPDVGRAHTAAEHRGVGRGIDLIEAIGRTEGNMQCSLLDPT